MPKRPDTQMGLELLVSFQNQNQNQSQNQSQEQNQRQNQNYQPQQPKGFFDEVGDFFNYTGETIKKSYQDNKVDEKLNNFGKQTKDVFEDIGHQTNQFFTNVSIFI